MSYSRFIIEVFAFDASLFAREAVRTSLMRSQAAMNFLFVRIYKTANIEYLEKKVKKTLSKCFDHMRNGESNIKRTSQYYLYLIQRERFKQCLRDLFLANSIFLSLTKYIKWRREYDAGLATACLIYYNYEEANSFCGKSLSQPVIHRFSIIQKFCNLSDIPLTHTTMSELSEEDQKYDLDNFYQNNEDCNSESDITSNLTHSLSIPKIQRLEANSSDNLIQKTTYSVRKYLESDRAIQFDGRSIDFTHTKNLSESSD